MTHEEMNISSELEQLRNDYAQLKKDLDRQEITNERLIRASIRKDLRFIDRKKWMGIPAFVAVAALMPYLSREIGLRMPFVIVTMVWMAILAVLNFIRMGGLDDKMMSMLSTQEFVREIKKRKQQQFRWLQVNVPLLLLWIGYFVGECIHADLPEELLYSLLGGMGTGLIIGGIAGMRIHNRIVGIYEGIILQLEDTETTDYIR